MPRCSCKAKAKPKAKKLPKAKKQAVPMKASVEMKKESMVQVRLAAPSQQLMKLIGAVFFLNAKPSSAKQKKVKLLAA